MEKLSIITFKRKKKIGIIKWTQRNILSIEQIKIRYTKNTLGFAPGQIIHIKYTFFREKWIKKVYFIGVCISISNKYNTFILKNKIKRENIVLLLYFFSPLIINIKVLNKYRKKYRLKKLYFKLI
jgi:ribosomal protein L19